MFKNCFVKNKATTTRSLNTYSLEITKFKVLIIKEPLITHPSFCKTLKNIVALLRHRHIAKPHCLCEKYSCNRHCNP